MSLPVEEKLRMLQKTRSQVERVLTLLKNYGMAPAPAATGVAPEVLADAHGQVNAVSAAATELLLDITPLLDKVPGASGADPSSGGMATHDPD